jgi:hypothetical protein
MAVAFRSVPRQVEPGLPPTAYHRSRVRESRPFLRRSGMSIPTRNRSLDGPPSHVAPVVTAVGPTRLSAPKPWNCPFPVARHESLYKFVGRENPAAFQSPSRVCLKRKVVPVGTLCHGGWLTEILSCDSHGLAIRNATIHRAGIDNSWPASTRCSRDAPVRRFRRARARSTVVNTRSI